ncbi:site-specific integrase [uncultured Cohaesibacter sp.]|uniref:tyrosine-type recombinase/integrase n=1 Tax=uncultured Cohaesibacter sp. TaxID=1002546 RepID=UPI0029C7BE61|nr:site-specific integrase [uncultured Cohaesibacter sp.]
MTVRLTNSFAKAVKFEGKQVRYFDVADTGFALVVGATKKTFIMSLRVGGKKKTETVGYFPEMSVDEAREKARKYRLAMREGLIAAGTLGDLMDHYFKVRGPELAANTLDLYLRLRKKFSDWEGLAPSELTVARCRTRFLKISEDDGPVAANAAAILCQTVLTWSIDKGLLPEHYPNPWLRVKRNPRSVRKRFMSQDEIKRYWVAMAELRAEGRRWQMGFFALEYLLLSGRRKDEALSLKHDMIDTATGTVSYPRTKTGPKVYYLSEAVAEMLGRVPKLKGCDYVFASFGKGNTPIDEHTLYGTHKAICERAGIDGLTVHDLRRTVGSQMRIAGFDLSDIADQLGHEDIGTTRRFYAHISPGRAKQRANQASDIMSGEGGGD